MASRGEKGEAGGLDELANDESRLRWYCVQCGDGPLSIVARALPRLWSKRSHESWIEEVVLISKVICSNSVA